MTKRQKIDEAYKAYKAINDPAYKAYKAISDPALKAYKAINDPARKAYEARLAEIEVEEAEEVCPTCNK